ncbi:MAG TPA: GDSL family lipase [Bacillus bacterium]|nr:GDSL family lipase [Bacillus sp. (in: firmicutes)]
MLKKLTLLYFCLVIVLVSCSQFESLEKGNFNKVKETGLQIKEALPPEFFPRDLNIVAAGDSLTQGVGDSTNTGGYLPYLVEQLEGEKAVNKVNIANFGVRGNRADQLLERLASEKVKNSIKDADIIILTIGGNDLMKVVKENFTNLELIHFKAEQAIFSDRLQKILTTIRQQNPEAPVVLIGLYNPFFQWFADVKEMNQIVDEWNGQSISIIQQDENAFFVDIHDIFINNEENLLYKDYFHPNDRGYQLIADRVYGILDREVIDSLQN